jgi:hypothetical protein
VLTTLARWQTASKSHLLAQRTFNLLYKRPRVRGTMNVKRFRTAHRASKIIHCKETPILQTAIFEPHTQPLTT